MMTKWGNRCILGYLPTDVFCIGVDELPVTKTASLQLRARLVGLL